MLHAPEQSVVGWLRLAPLLGLALCGLVGACAYQGNRFFPILSGDVLLLALPLFGFAWLRLRGEPAAEPWAWWWVLGACGLLAWQALVNAVQPTVPPIAWAHFGNRCLLLSAAAIVLSAPGGVGLAVRLLAMSSAVAIWIYGGPHLSALFGGRIATFFNMGHGNAIYGNVSWIVNAAAPALVAYVVLRSLERQRERPIHLAAGIALGLLLLFALFGILQKRGVLGFDIPQWAFMSGAVAWAVGMALWWGVTRGSWSGARCWEGWVVLAGSAMLLIVSIPTARRGFLLFLILVALWFLWDWVRRQWPRIAWGALAVVVAVAVIGGLAVLLGTDIMRHQDRAMQARAALEAAGSVFPWGWGGYPALQFHDSAPDNGDYIITWMKIHDHVHSEVLELLLQAGWFGMFAALALASWLVIRVARIADPLLRAGAMTCGLGASVPLMTDNTVFTTMGACAIGCYIGVMLKGAATPSGTAATPMPAALNWARLALLPVALAAAVTCWQTAQVAAIGTNITSEAPILSGIANAKDVYVAKTLSNVGLMAAANAKRSDVGVRIIAAVDERIGDVPWGLEQYNYVLEAGVDPRRRAESCIECLRFYPFEDRYYQLLDQLRTAEPSVASIIPDTVLRRLDTLYRPAKAQPISYAQPPRTVNEAADQYVRLRALFSYGGDATGVSDALAGLLQRYRLIPNLTKLVLEGIILLPEPAAEDIALRSKDWTMYPPAGDTMAVFLSMMVKNRPAAVRVLPVIRRLYPDESALLDRAIAGESVGTVPALVGTMLSLHGLIIKE